MFRIRKIVDDAAPANRAAIEQVQAILRDQFPGLPAGKTDKLAKQLHDPMRFRYRTVLFVAEDSRDRVRACAVLLYAPDLNFGFLDLISAAPGKTGGGMGDWPSAEALIEAQPVGVLLADLGIGA